MQFKTNRDVHAHARDHTHSTNHANLYMYLLFITHPSSPTANTFVIIKRMIFKSISIRILLPAICKKSERLYLFKILILY